MSTIAVVCRYLTSRPHSFHISMCTSTYAYQHMKGVVVFLLLYNRL